MLIDTDHPAARFMSVCEMDGDRIVKMIQLCQCVNLDSLAFSRLDLSGLDNGLRRSTRDAGVATGVAGEVLWAEHTQPKTVFRLVDQFPALAELRYACQGMAVEGMRRGARRRVQERAGSICRRCDSQPLGVSHFCANHMPEGSDRYRFRVPVPRGRFGHLQYIVDATRGFYAFVWTDRPPMGKILELVAGREGKASRITCTWIGNSTYMAHLTDAASKPYDWISTGRLDSNHEKIFAMADRPAVAPEPKGSIINPTPSIFGL